MRAFRRMATVAAIAGLFAAPAIGAASAATLSSTAAKAPAAAAVHLKGGVTAVTTAPGIAQALLKNGIVPIATSPGTESLRAAPSGPAAEFAFPVTGGQVRLSPLGGYIDHRGGILFFNAKNGKQIEVSDFVISLNHADLTGIVNGNPKARVPLLRLNLSHATLKAGKHSVVAKGISLTLTKTAAGALNTALGTKLFAAGLGLGSAQTVLRF
jgi:hypothetical protein